MLLLLTACTAPVVNGGSGLRMTADIVWSEPDNWFGGFSGAELSTDGSHLTAITDRGRLVTARMLRRGEALIGVEVIRSVSLRDAAGRPLREDDVDAEGLALLPSGGFLISFEQNHRIMALDPDTGRTTDTPQNSAFAALHSNSGLEALAVHPDGTAYTLPERSGGASMPFPLYALKGSVWQIAALIPRAGPFLPVGADFAPDGRLYLLERTVTLLGFRSRIRRFDLSAADLAPQTLLTTGPGHFDNMETIAVWQDKQGATRLTLIADDNFLAIEKTEIVEFVLSD